MVRRELTTGNLTSFTYHTSNIDVASCKHKKFEVDETSIEKRSEKTLSGSILGMMTAGWLETRYHYLVGKARCYRCDRRFLARCEYTDATVWSDYKKVNEQKREPWTIMTRSVVKNASTTEKEILYIE